MLQVRRTARRFEPSVLLSVLRSFVTLAAPAHHASAGPTAASSTPRSLDLPAVPPALVLPADVVDALASDIRVRHLQFSKLQRSEVCRSAGTMLLAVYMRVDDADQVLTCVPSKC